MNLKEIFGVDLQGKEELKLAMAEALLQKMLDKTAKGKSRTGKVFKKYSKAYMASEDFKAFGKTSKVNLDLTGDMLGLIEVIDESPNTVTLGWDDKTEAAKAHGHINGNKVTRLPVRDFFGLNQKDIAAVKNKFTSELSSLAEATDKQKAILAFIERLEEEDGQA